MYFINKIDMYNLHIKLVQPDHPGQYKKYEQNPSDYTIGKLIAKIVDQKANKNSVLLQ